MTIRRYSTFVAVLFLAGCTLMPGSGPARSPTVYLIDTRVLAVNSVVDCHVVVVNPPDLAPGQLGAQMLYQREPYRLERFAYSRWAASPAAMLEPLLLDALRNDSRYSAVVSAPAAVRADLRIENDELWLVQKFDGESSNVELRMSSRVYVPEQRQLAAVRNFNVTVAAGEGTPRGGVEAAERAVRQLLEEFREFVGAAADSLDNNCEE